MAVSHLIQRFPCYFPCYQGSLPAEHGTVWTATTTIHPLTGKGTFGARRKRSRDCRLAGPIPLDPPRAIVSSCRRAHPGEPPEG